MRRCSRYQPSRGGGVQRHWGVWSAPSPDGTVRAGRSTTKRRKERAKLGDSWKWPREAVGKAAGNGCRPTVRRRPLPCAHRPPGVDAAPSPRPPHTPRGPRPAHLHRLGHAQVDAVHLLIEAELLQIARVRALDPALEVLIVLQPCGRRAGTCGGCIRATRSNTPGCPLCATLVFTQNFCDSTQKRDKNSILCGVFYAELGFVDQCLLTDRKLLLFVCFCLRLALGRGEGHSFWCH